MMSPTNRNDDSVHVKTAVRMFGPDHPMRLLYVEDSPMDARLFLDKMRASTVACELDITHAHTLAEACAALENTAYDCVLLDLGLSDGQGVDNITRLLRVKPKMTIVVITGDDSDEVGLNAINNGAQEYLVKGQVEYCMLYRILRHAVQRNELLQELKTLREREYFQATHDALTGLPNRQLFEDRANQIMVRAQRNNEQMAICYLDIDGFKPVNDSFGHAVGDELLKAVAVCLEEAVRDSDTVARVGGDEFVLMLYPLESRQEAQRIASRIVEKILSIRQASGHTIRVSASVGMCLYPSQGSNLKELMHYADQAMYHSKSQRRGGFEFFDVSMLGKTLDRELMIGEIDEALRQGRFYMDYQPWWNVQDGQIQGVEALLRWRTKTGEIRHPRLFLSIAEGSGQILKIAREVNAKCLADWRSWHDDRLGPGQLALNLSVRELRDTHYLRELTTLRDELDVLRGSIQLHIDANSLKAMDTPTLAMKLEYLRTMGYRVVLDSVTDSNVSTESLNTLGFDEIRIDAGVVGRMATINSDQIPRGQGAAFISEVLSLVGRKSAQVVIVGVETQAQADQLKRLGCNLMQGFLFGLPMSSERMSGLLRKK